MCTYESRPFFAIFDIKSLKKTVGSHPECTKELQPNCNKNIPTSKIPLFLSMFENLVSSIEINIRISSNSNVINYK